MNAIKIFVKITCEMDFVPINGYWFVEKYVL